MEKTDTLKGLLGSNEKAEYVFSVSDRYKKVSLIFWLVIGVILLFAGGIGLFVIIIAVFYFSYYLKEANLFVFTNKRVLVRKGWLSKNTTSVDYSKITDIHVNEPFIDKIFYQSGNLLINTAGTGVHEVVLKHIAEPYEVKKRLDALVNE